MAEHTPTPWMTNRAGEMLPDDWIIMADLGKCPNGIKQVSTVARALSIRQTPETTAANAEFIVRAVNSHDALVKALEVLLSEAESFSVSGVYFSEECMGHKGPALARAALAAALPTGEAG